MLYCVNKNPQSPGREHEVHNVSTCIRLPDPINRQSLGYHLSCGPAKTEAKKYFDNVDGCYWCCKPCHTR